MNTQKARNTAAGMVRDALERLTEWGRVQDLRSFDNTKEEATRLLDFAEAALSYFEQHYDFPQEEATAKIAKIQAVFEEDDEDEWDADKLRRIEEIAYGWDEKKEDA